MCPAGSLGLVGRVGSVSKWQGFGCRKWLGAIILGDPFSCAHPDPYSCQGPFPGKGGRGYLRFSSPTGRLTRLKKTVSCSRPRQHWVSLGTKVGYQDGSGSESSPLSCPHELGWSLTLALSAAWPGPGSRPVWAHALA